MNLLEARAEQFCELIKLTTGTADGVLSTEGWLEIDAAVRLKDDLTLAIQSYDAYMASLSKAANEYMEEGESLDSILTSMEKG